MSRDNTHTLMRIEQDHTYNAAGSVLTDVHLSLSAHDHTYCTSLSEREFSSQPNRVLGRDHNYYSPDAPCSPHSSRIQTSTDRDGLNLQQNIDIRPLNDKSCSDTEYMHTNYNHNSSLHNDQQQVESPFQCHDVYNAQNYVRNKPVYSSFHKLKKFTVTDTGLVHTVCDYGKQDTNGPRPNSELAQPEQRLHHMDHANITTLNAQHKQSPPKYSTFGNTNTNIRPRYIDTESPTYRRDNILSPSNNTIPGAGLPLVNINIEKNNDHPGEPLRVSAEPLTGDSTTSHTDAMPVSCSFEEEEKSKTDSMVTINIREQYEQETTKADSITEINNIDETQPSGTVTAISLSPRDAQGKVNAENVSEKIKHITIRPRRKSNADYIEVRRRRVECLTIDGSDILIIACVLCYATFTTSLDLARHSILQHPVSVLYKCFKCGQIFTSKGGWRKKHVNACMARDTGPYMENNDHTCKKVNIGDFSVKTDLDNTEIEAIHGESGINGIIEVYECPCCKRVFSSPVDLHRHQINVTVEMNAIPIYICDFCRKPIRYIHSCFACKHVFCTDKHLHIHTSQKHYHSLLRYRRIWEDPKCQLCGMVKDRLRMHSRCRTIFCTWCYGEHKTYTRQLYVCAKCKVEFDNVCAVNSHVLVCCPVVEDTTTPDIAPTPSHIGATQHVNDGLSVIGPRRIHDVYVCAKCKVVFNTACAVTEHILACSPVVEATTTSGVAPTPSVIGTAEHANNRISDIGHEEQLPTEYDGESPIPHEEKPYVYVENVEQNDDDENVSPSSAGQEVSVAPMTSLKFQKPTELYMCHRCGDIFTVECDLRKHVTLGVCDSRIVPKTETVESCFVETYMSNDHLSDNEHSNMETQSIDDYGSDNVSIKQEPANTGYNFTSSSG